MQFTAAHTIPQKFFNLYIWNGNYNNTQSQKRIIWYSDLATGYTIRDSYTGRGKIFFFSPKHPNCLWGPPNLLPTVYQVLFPRVKQPGLEAAPSPPSSAKVKNEWRYTSIAPYACKAGTRYNPTPSTKKEWEDVLQVHIISILLFALYS
jgi:hypothetical protein